MQLTWNQLARSDRSQHESHWMARCFTALLHNWQGYLGQQGPELTLVPVSLQRSNRRTKVCLLCIVVCLMFEPRWGTAIVVCKCLLVIVVGVLFVYFIVSVSVKSGTLFLCLFFHLPMTWNLSKGKCQDTSHPNLDLHPLLLLLLQSFVQGLATNWIYYFYLFCSS